MLPILICDPSKEFVLQASRTLKERISSKGLDARIVRVSLSSGAILGHLAESRDVHYALVNLMFQDVSVQVREGNRNSYLVFSAEHDAQIQQAFDGLLRPSGIHIKPVRTKEIADLFESAYADYLLLDTDNDCLSVSFGAQMHRLRYKDILYFEAAEKKLFAVTRAQRIGFYGTLDEIGRNLPVERFLRVHKGFIANLGRIREVDWHGMLVRFSERDAIPMSRSCKGAVRAALDCETVDLSEETSRLSDSVASGGQTDRIRDGG